MHTTDCDIGLGWSVFSSLAGEEQDQNEAGWEGVRPAVTLDGVFDAPVPLTVTNARGI